MNIRRITHYLKLKEQLTETELQLADTFASLSETDRGLLVESLGPVKRTTRKKTGGGKSSRAQSLAGAVGGALGGIQRCGALVDDKPCGEPQGHALHEDQAYASYHPFVSQSSAVSAQGKSLSSKSSVTNSAASSETGKDDAQGVAAGSGGD